MSNLKTWDEQCSLLIGLNPYVCTKKHSSGYFPQTLLAHRCFPAAWKKAVGVSRGLSTQTASLSISGDIFWGFQRALSPGLCFACSSKNAQCWSWHWRFGIRCYKAEDARSSRGAAPRFALGCLWPVTDRSCSTSSLIWVLFGNWKAQ